MPTAAAALPLPEQELPPLPPFPWLVRSDPGLPPLQPAGRSAGHGGGARGLHAGIALAIAALCGGGAVVAGWPAEEPAPAVQLARLPQAAASAAAPAPVDAGTTESPALIAEPSASANSDVLVRPSVPAPVQPQRIDPAPAAEQAVAASPAPAVAPPAPPLADSPASAAMLAEFRSVMDESRDAARQVIRLASRDRPAHDASAEALRGHSLRQQNAEAARGYRRYLDTLSRSMRGKPSQATAQQSLERARQTLAYLTTMLADSQASRR